MFRHHNISNHYEAVALASLLQHGEEAVTAPRGSQKRQAPIARTRDKVQVSGAVVSMQAARHDKHYAISGIAAPPLQKTQGWGTHVSLWERKTERRERVGQPPISGVGTGTAREEMGNSLLDVHSTLGSRTWAL